MSERKNRARRPKMKDRAYARWRRQLAQLERRKGLANNPDPMGAFFRAARRAEKADPAKSAWSLDELQPFLDPADPIVPFYRKVPPAVGHERNRQLRRRR
jgi:hypothetical protein